MRIERQQFKGEYINQYHVKVQGTWYVTKAYHPVQVVDQAFDSLEKYYKAASTKIYTSK